MRILLLTSEFAPAAGGIGTYAREIASAATELGADVTLVAPDYGEDNSDNDRLLPFAVKRYQGGLHAMRHLPEKIGLARRTIAADQYDIVHAVDWPFFIPVALARGLTSAGIIATVHGTEINETQTALKRLAIKSAGVFGPRTTIAANSNYTAELFRQKFPVSPKQVRAIPLGVSDDWFAGRATRGAVRRHLGLDDDRIVIVTVARITRRKGHRATLQALAMLPGALRKRITWLLIGPDGETDCVKELRAGVATTDCEVRFMGALPDHEIRAIYAAADFFCLTGIPDTSGRVEGFGLVYLEAGAAGLPSVATDIGGVADAVCADRSGLLVAPAADEIARAIATMAENADLRRSLAAGARAHAQHLSWRRCAAATYGLAHSDERVGDEADTDHARAAFDPRPTGVVAQNLSA